jgi:hypothetical protein
MVEYAGGRSERGSTAEAILTADAARRRDLWVWRALLGSGNHKSAVALPISLISP